MTTHNTFRAADILEAQNHAAEQSAKARAAVRSALAAAGLLLISADELALVSRGAREACMSRFLDDARRVREALDAAAILLDRVDPLGEVDTSVDHEGLILAGMDFRAALVTLGVEIRSLAA